MMIPNQKGQMEEQIDFSKTTEITSSTFKSIERHY